MTFVQAVALGFANCVNFSGRAVRAEFWLWFLFAALGAIITNIIDAAVFVYHPGMSPLNSPLSNLFTLVALLPSLAVAIRRLHDVDRTGWWMLVVPTGIGICLLLWWQAQVSTPCRNKFGPCPAADGWSGSDEAI